MLSTLVDEYPVRQGGTANLTLRRGEIPGLLTALNAGNGYEVTAGSTAAAPRGGACPLAGLEVTEAIYSA